MATVAHPRPARMTAVRRQAETVTPLELFFDLVFVLALTQCTALMAERPTWTGLAQALLVLAMLWWSWIGYAWLTSVVDPEEGAVRLVMFVAMAAFLVAALCVPGAFDAAAGTFAVAYAVVRIAHIGLFVIASRDEPGLRASVIGLSVSTAIGVGLLGAAAFADGELQALLWVLAVVIDAGGPFLFGVEGWQLVPSHYAERFGLITIIALGESIVAIGIGVGSEIDLGVVVAAVLGTAIAAALWWLYFDVVALAAQRRLAAAAVGREQNSMARDSYSYLHFPIVAGIVLLALGLKKTVGHVDEPLKLIPAVGLLGGVAVYLLAHVAFRLRNVHSLNGPRLGCAVLLLALIPLAPELPALATQALVALVVCSLVAFEALHDAETRDRVRHQIEEERAMDSAPA